MEMLRLFLFVVHMERVFGSALDHQCLYSFCHQAVLRGIDPGDVSVGREVNQVGECASPVSRSRQSMDQLDVVCHRRPWSCVDIVV